jgi:citrate synthase
MHRNSQFMSELPAIPEYNPVRKAIADTTDAQTASALRLFASMPASTSVFANPVRYHRTVGCDGTSVDLNIRSFGIRGCLLEEDIVNGSADAVRVIFVGLFGRFATAEERRSFSALLSREFKTAVKRTLPDVAKFMNKFPEAHADAAMQYIASLRKAANELRPVHASRPAGELLRDLLRVHIENAAVGACSSYMRSLTNRRESKTKSFLESIHENDLFGTIFSLLLRRKVNPTEAVILENNGTIQIHHGSAGSNMIARYLASLHAKSVSDIFSASQMALDAARHFGAIDDLTEFVARLDGLSPEKQDELIRQRAMEGNLPVFGHPEIAAAGRSNRIELDPRPALYLAPLFEAIDTGRIEVSGPRLKRVRIVQRMYQLAFVEGIEKPNRSGRLRVTPNTDFGTWILAEVLGIDETDRTLLSYVFRGFGWMMDVREQLQQPIIRPVIPPDPSIIPEETGEGAISEIVGAIHDRLCEPNAFASHKSSRNLRNSRLLSAYCKIPPNSFSKEP